MHRLIGIDWLHLSFLSSVFHFPSNPRQLCLDSWRGLLAIFPISLNPTGSWRSSLLVPCPLPPSPFPQTCHSWRTVAPATSHAETAAAAAAATTQRCLRPRAAHRRRSTHELKLSDRGPSPSTTMHPHPRILSSSENELNEVAGRVGLGERVSGSPSLIHRIVQCVLHSVFVRLSRHCNDAVESLSKLPRRERAPHCTLYHSHAFFSRHQLSLCRSVESSTKEKETDCHSFCAT